MSGVDEEGLPRDFGKYRLTRRIARGGMAQVFLAHRHDAPLEPLVIKQLLPHLELRDDFRELFVSEAKLAAQLEHPNIVRIEEIGRVETSTFLAMEYVHGEDVRAIYNRAYRLERTLPLAHSVRVLADAARALAYAHGASDDAGRPMNLVHRDVSPQNILVTYEGQTKVVDFGLARAAGTIDQTSGALLKGKYSYMSPEQAVGEGVDHRTDLFALGIILYETTTGTRLFKRANELATLQAIMQCAFAPPSQVLPGYPPELEAIVLSALARGPEDRYQSGETLADDLERFLRSCRIDNPRNRIGAFMAELFSEKLALEEGTGEPALPDPACAQEDLGDLGDLDFGGGGASATETDVSSPFRTPQARIPTEVGPRRRRRGIEPGATDPQALNAEAAATPEAVLASGFDVAPEDTFSEDPIDDPLDAAKTVAVAPAYRAPDGEAPKETRPHDDPTDRIRMRAAAPPTPAFSKLRQRAPTRARRRAWTPFRVGVWSLLGVAVGAWALGAFAPPPPPARTPAEPMGVLSVVTEPGAEVYVDGEALGAADPEGRAGPFAVPAGARVIRVVHGETRFERQQALEVEADRRHETEVRARRGFVRLRVAPWARVRVNGKPMGLTPLPPISLFEGLHEIELENPVLGVRKTVSARVLAGEEQLVEVVLARGS